MTDPATLLQQTFGHTTFKPGQEDVVRILLEGRSALAVFPTGGGKSLCYQLPALVLEGLTLVVSPLIALMKDQVEAMQKQGVAAARLDSSLEAGEIRAIYDQMASGELKLLYVAPERLANEGFLQKLRRTRISLMAIDEAHCISEWGHNFRPDYLKLGRMAQDLGIQQVLCLTATATPRVSQDIRGHFRIEEADHVQTGFRRPNLNFMVTACPAESRMSKLAGRIRKREPGAAIVYVTLQQTAEQVAGYLTEQGFSAKAYHAGLPDDYRAEVQDDFMGGRVDIVVATIAFGMGIDKADIRYVYHYNLPKSLENYVQESGRAGRDGKESICEILACEDDRIVLENFVHGDTPTSQAVRSLVEHLFMQGESFSVSRYDLSGTNDIRPLVVATALTHLELKGLLLPTGPFYGSYRFKFVEPMHRILAGHKPERKAFLERLFAASKKGRTWYTVDIQEVADALSEPSDRVQKALNYLSELGEIVLQPSGLRHGYRLNPEHDPHVGRITEELQELYEHREKAEVLRLGDVIDFCQTPHCLTRALVSYFGEDMEKDCGTCGNCRTGGEDTERRELPCSLPEHVPTEQLPMIQALIEEKHSSLRQPRQLARFLCGITSPATTRQRLTRNDRFGALSQVPFIAVLTQVESMLTR